MIRRPNVCSTLVLLAAGGVGGCKNYGPGSSRERDAAADLADAAEIEEPPDPPGPSPWTRRTPAALSPASRFGHALAYDPVRGKVVLFGGSSERALRDLWEWNGEAGTWTDLTPTAFPAAWPTARLGHALAWDDTRKRVVLFAGDTGRNVWLRDLWEWDGQSGTWTNRTPKPFPTAWPGPRWGHAMDADRTRKKLVLFGGGFAFSDAGSHVPFADTWEWDGELGTWAERTPSPKPMEWPGGRAEAGLTWDAQRQRVVMAMGHGHGAAPYDPAVWEWDGAAGLWHGTPPASPPPLSPTGRSGHTFVRDEARDRMLLFGGWQETPPGEPPADPGRDAWELGPSAGTWSDRTLAPRSAPWPLGRVRHAMVLDARRGRLLLFGGKTNQGLLHDTWEWDGSIWPGGTGTDGGSQ